MAEHRAHGRATERIASWLWTETSLSASLARALLLPLTVTFGIVQAWRAWLYDRGVLAIRRVAVPVLSVGNLTVGGSGKTPFAAWLVGQLLAKGRRPALLHGGYADDEPALHRLWHPDVPVYAGRQRAASAPAAVSRGADVLVLDDGFQHRRLARDLDLVLVAAEQWSSQRHLLPAGPWREPATALQRANIIVITRKTASAERAAEVSRDVQAITGMTVPVAVAAILPAGWRRRADAVPAGGPDRAGADRTVPVSSGAPQGDVVAVAGIARPDLFAANARAAGAQIVESIWFPDHHAYDVRDADRIAREADGRAIVTTAKDALKLERLLPADHLWVLEQEVRVERGDAALRALVEQVLA